MREVVWQPWSPGIFVATPGLAAVVGHRGAAARAPENTLAGLRKAHELGARWVEFDVMLTGDDVPVLIHDETLDRTTSGQGPVPVHDLASIRALDAGSWFGPAFAGERVPTLEEAVALLLELGLAANVEIKPAEGHEARTGEAVAAFLRDRWPADGPKLLLSSFAREALVAAKAAAPQLPRGLLAEAPPDDWAEAMQELACATLHLSHGDTPEDSLKHLVEAGVPVLLYTVNDPARATALLAAGARSIITDEPDAVLAALAPQ